MYLTILCLNLALLLVCVLYFFHVVWGRRSASYLKEITRGKSGNVGWRVIVKGNLSGGSMTKLEATIAKQPLLAVVQGR
jgi:hypothetical protein